MRQTVRDFRKLQVWQKGHQMVLRVYEATTRFPKAEVYGLTSQLRRAAVSIPANIAEDCGRTGQAELARFMSIAQGSATEVRYYCILARDLGYLPESLANELSNHTDEINRMLTSYIARLKANG